MQSSTVPEPTSLVGSTLFDRYDVIETIGSGAMGTVYRALQWPLRRPVALKVLSHEALSDPKVVRRFINEARILAAVQHSNILPLIEFGRLDDGRLVLVTDFVAGGSLRDLMQGEPIPPWRAVRIARQAARGLGEAHAHGIIHRDLKPENILLDAVRSKQMSVRLIDFGLAKDPAGAVADGEELTHPGTRLGTPGYMSPEQTFREKLDISTDLYALGAILYEMLTAEPVFRCDTVEGLYMAHRYQEIPRPSERRPDAGISPHLDEVVLQLLAKLPADRPESAAAVVRELELILRELPTPGGDIRLTPFGLPAVPGPPAPKLSPLPAKQPAPTRSRRSRVFLPVAIVFGFIAGIVTTLILT